MGLVSANLHWSPNPMVFVVTALVDFVYLRRWRAVRGGSSPRAHADAPVWRMCSFLASGVIVIVALISPIDSLADQLFFAHMIQHMLLLDLAPILAILGYTKVFLRPITRKVNDFERRAGILAHPATAVLLYIGGIWVWHIPAAYDFAVSHPLVHICEHLTFLAIGALYWWHLLSPIRARQRLDGMGPVFYMASTKLFVGALGMGLAFAPSALYPYYVHHARPWGLSALTDQSIAGLIMAVEQSLVMGIALVVLFVRALSESERTQQREERYELS